MCEIPDIFFKVHSNCWARDLEPDGPNYKSGLNGMANVKSKYVLTEKNVIYTLVASGGRTQGEVQKVKFI